MSKFTDHIKQVIANDIRLCFSPFIMVFRAMRRATQSLRAGYRIFGIKVKHGLTRHKTKDDQ